MREILVPAYQCVLFAFKTDDRIINPDRPTLTFPSDLYDTLRFSAVTSELIVLRILKFELRVTLPQTYLPRLISRCLPHKKSETHVDVVDNFAGMIQTNVDKLNVFHVDVLGGQIDEPS